MKQLALSPCQDTTTAVCACPATPLELRDLHCLSWLVTTGSKHAKFEFKKIIKHAISIFLIFYNKKIIFKL